MKQTNSKQEIRHKVTIELSDFELSEKIRIINKELSQFDRDLIKLSRQIYEVHCKRDKRNKYLATLRKDLRLRKEKKMLSEFDDIE